MRKMIAETTILKRTTKIKDSNILEEIRSNNTREKEVNQALEKEDRLIWEENRIVYMEGRIYILNNKKIIT